MRRGKPGRPGRPVMCIETGRVFSSAKEAGQWAGVSSSTIHNALNGYIESAGGYSWEFVDAEKEEKTVLRPRSAPTMSITQVQREAERRSKEAGRMVRYADIQKEETLLMLRRQAAREKVKKRKVRA